MRNVWRALIRDQKSLLLQTLKIYYVFRYFLRPCPPHHNVPPRARRRSVPSRILGDPLAVSAARSRPECRHEPDLSEFDPPRPPRRSPTMLQPRRAHISTTKVVSSGGGGAMYMKRPDGIGRGSWDWENPTQESANHIPALPVLTGHAIGCPGADGSG